MTFSDCPSCGLPAELEENPFIPCCSAVCKTLWRHGLAWRVNPYRVVVISHPHLVVQDGPNFDLRESALKGAKERTLAAQRKQRQRYRERIFQMPRQVTPMAQYKPLIRASDAIFRAQNADVEAKDG